MKVGFIGLGIMGLPMAKNMIKSGFSLVVYNRSMKPIKELTAMGAEAGSSPSDVATKCEILITMLPDSPDVQEVVLGKGGVIEGAKPGMILIDMSTISPKISVEISEALAESGVEMLDAPVSGGQKGAIEGSLSIMVGGKKEFFERCMPLFKSIGKTIVLVGGNGAGETVKLCNQVICAINIVSMCEGMSLCRRAGVDVEKMVEVVSGGLGASNIITNLAPKILKGEMEPGFKLHLQQKDNRLALQLAEELKLPLPAIGLVSQIFRIAEANGLGDKGTQALIKAYERLGGIHLNYREIKDGIVLTVYVKPSSKGNIITAGEELVVETTECASQNKANIAVIKDLAKTLGVPSTSIRIVRGSTNSVKQILVAGITLDELRKRLKLN